MPVLAHASRDLILDVFGKKITIKSVDKYALSNNILVYNIDNNLYRLNLNTDLPNENKSLCEIPVGIHELKISEKGLNFGVLLKNSDFFVYSKSNLLLSKSNINTFEISDKIVGYETETDLVLQDLESQEIIHKSTFNFQKYFIFHDFCILSTTKQKNADNEDEFKLLKITKEIVKEIAHFRALVDMKCKCNSEGSFVLVNLSTSYVKNSYFASTVLYMYDVQNNTFERVNKLTNILDFTFIKKGFCVVYGSQPAYVTTFNYDFSINEKYPKGVRNRIYFNHQETHVVLAGFEQLAGNVETYDVETKEKWSTANELGASKIEWDQNGSYYYVSTLKYLKEDNRVTMYDYYGRLIISEKFDSLNDVSVYGLPEKFKILEKPIEKFVDKEEEAYVPSILKGNSTFKVSTVPKVKPAPKINPVETEEELIEKVLKIEKLKEMIERNEKLDTEDLNLILNEGKIIKKLNALRNLKK